MSTIKSAILLLPALLSITYIDMAETGTIASSGPNMLTPYLNKKYKLDTSENFEEVMKALGVGYLKRKLGNLAKPVIELTEENGLFTLITESPFKDMAIKFRLGEEFKEVTPDDREVHSVVTQEGAKLVQVQKGEKTTTITREFSDQGVKVTVEVDGIVSVRHYVPINLD